MPISKLEFNQFQHFFGPRMKAQWEATFARTPKNLKSLFNFLYCYRSIFLSDGKSVDEYNEVIKKAWSRFSEHEIKTAEGGATILMRILFIDATYDLDTINFVIQNTKEGVNTYCEDGANGEHYAIMSLIKSVKKKSIPAIIEYSSRERLSEALKLIELYIFGKEHMKSKKPGIYDQYTLDELKNYQALINRKLLEAKLYYLPGRKSIAARMYPIKPVQPNSEPVPSQALAQPNLVNISLLGPTDVTEKTSDNIPLLQ